MNNFYEFAGQHPIITVVLAVVLASTPASIIRALRAKPRTIILNTKNKSND